MMYTLLMTIGVVVGLMLVWTLVQNQWKKVFADQVNDEDAMAERTKCSNCNCTTICKHKIEDQLNE